MTVGIADLAGEQSDKSKLKVVSTEYTEQNDTPITHIFGRDANGKFHHVEVEGHRPSFYIADDEHGRRVDNHYAVHHTEKYDDDGSRYTNLHGEALVRVYTYLPGQVADLRELFTDHYEADVFYTKRFLIDNEIHTGIEVDTSGAIREPWIKGDYRISVGDIRPLDRAETPSVDPHVLTVDIEVAGEEGVPDKDRAEYPVSTIVAGSDGEYMGWALEADEWDVNPTLLADETGLDGLRVFDDESEMLHDFNEFVGRLNPDIITGWYSNDFDIPYLYNRSKNLNVYNYSQWSPLEEVFLTKYEPVIKGVECVDMLEGYRKTQIHKLDSKKLDDVAADEVGATKHDIELSHTEMWRERPVEFLKYNKRDVELVERIEQAATNEGIIQFLDNLRILVGCSYTDPLGGNIDMMDTLFLRKAAEKGYALPTAEKPEVGDFHGAWVFQPKAGLHSHCVYPDYSSLYPNVQYQCNISPETLIGTAEDLEASEYTEDDCVWSYIDDTTPPPLKQDVEVTEGRMEKIYFLDPSVEEGFIRSVLDDVMGMCDAYTGGLYAAAKRVRNSSWGVFGDSDSYGTGFRLFDWRLAESTTLGGQKVLKGGVEKFIDVIDYDDAYLVGGDTDSYMTSLPSAQSAEDALTAAQSAAETTNDWLDGYTMETFGLPSEADARMELEIETYASRLFFKGAEDGKSDQAKKKRYAQLVEWNDDDLWLDEPELTIKGFEYVRSDVAPITKDVQYRVFESMMRMDSDSAEADIKHVIEEVIRDVTTDKKEGGTSFYEHEDDIGIPFGIGQKLTEYGSTDRTPQPPYRGAKYANKFIYGGDAIAEGDKPRYWYTVEGATGEELRKTYKAHTREDGRYVDAISAHTWEDVPEGVEIDRPKMVEKTIIDPLEGIVRTMDWGVDWMREAKELYTPAEYYRSEGQEGLDAWEAM